MSMRGILVNSKIVFLIPLVDSNNQAGCSQQVGTCDAAQHAFHANARAGGTSNERRKAGEATLQRSLAADSRSAFVLRHNIKGRREDIACKESSKQTKTNAAKHVIVAESELPRKCRLGAQRVRLITKINPRRRAARV